MLKAKKIVLIVASMSMLLTGCGSNKKEKGPKCVRLPEYDKQLYDTVEITRGDVTPEFTFDLVAPKYERKSYKTLYDEMEVEQLHVAVGDHVKKGDILISFKSGKIGEEIEEYKKQLGEQQLLLEHLNKLSGIASDEDYSKEIAQLKDSIQVTNLYINELQARLEAYNFKADADGTVFSINDIVYYGIIDTTCSNVISVSYGNDQFYGETSNDYDFQVGQHFTAYYGVAPYEMVLESIEEKGKDSNGNVIKGLTFVGADGVDFGYRDRLSLVVQLDTLKNVMFLPNECVIKKEDSSFVYVLDENGYRRAVEVECGPTILDNTVILSGLQDGERVVIK